MAESKAKKPRKKKEEAGYRLTPKGCMCCAFDKVMPGLVTDDQKDLVWMVFEDLMRKHGYVEDEKK
jgi:hypothetical protein